MKASLYETLKSAVKNPDTDIDTHESDIYVLKTPETTKIIQNYYDEMKLPNQATEFTDEITHRCFYDVPFGYMYEHMNKLKEKEGNL